MKILVCVDGSEQSQKAIEVASLIAEGPQVEDVALIHVYENKLDPYSSSTWGGEGYAVSQMDVEHLKERYEKEKEKGNRILQKARIFFEAKNIKARTILKEGHPADRIVETASEEGFDMIVIGSRGLGGLQRLFLGSVSNAVVQEAKNCSVIVVK
jgi:nucleotide-binding universal stress UspA family protein